MKIKDLTNGMVVKPSKTFFDVIMNGGFVHARNIRLPSTFIFIEATIVGPDISCFYYYDGQQKYACVPSDLEYELTEDPVLVASYKDAALTQLILSNPYSAGSDPEIFVVDEADNIIPSFHFLSSKQEKLHRGASSTYGNLPIYWDGFQAEFETYASSCLSWQLDSIHLALKGLLTHAKKHNPNARLSIKTTMDIPYEMLQEAKEEHVQFGCMPSFNAYGMEGIKMHGREVPFRSAGGHIHLGMMSIHKNPETIIKMVKAMDVVLGVASVSLFNVYDNPIRRSMYGLAGEYRTPSHGLEYRVLSNAWLCHPLIANIVFDLARIAANLGREDRMDTFKYNEADVISCINNCDIDAARAFMETNKDMYMRIFMNKYGNQMAEHIYNIFYNGMQSVILNPEDIEGNWNLNSGWVRHCDGKDKNVGKATESLINKTKVA